MYEKPMFFETDDLAEGIYLASGSEESENCWIVTVKRSHQKPVASRMSTKFQIDMHHTLGEGNQIHHGQKPQRLYLVFDQPVDVVECNEGHLVGNGKGVSQIEVDFYTEDNGNESIGWGGLAVATADDSKASITKAWMTD